eukprot:TRINITY_DN7733_c0_g1_i1.p1 TRINITY_DN7733_c0_g1~~TRINITY_DN7733_c0_g1_i1.p1  ORF type:complete len:169 (+),score=3.36 TRINITY_DN7733_c0_g1_i1:3-509(+)
MAPCYTRATLARSKPAAFSMRATKSRAMARRCWLRRTSQLVETSKAPGGLESVAYQVSHLTRSLFQASICRHPVRNAARSDALQKRDLSRQGSAFVDSDPVSAKRHFMPHCARDDDYCVREKKQEQQKTRKRKKRKKEKRNRKKKKKDRKSTRLNSLHQFVSPLPFFA